MPVAQGVARPVAQGLGVCFQRSQRLVPIQPVTRCQAVGASQDVVSLARYQAGQVGLGLHPVQQAQGFGGKCARLGDVLGIGVAASGSQRKGAEFMIGRGPNIADRRQASHTHPQMVVEHVMVSRVKQASFFQDRAAHEHGRLADDAKTHQFVEVPLSKGQMVNGTAPWVDGDCIPKDHAQRGVVLHDLHGALDRSRQVEIIRVQPGHNLAPGALHALVDRFGLPGIRLGDPPGQAVGIALDDGRAVIAGTTIHHDIFKRRVSLRQYRAQGMLQIGGLVVGGSDDGNEGRSAHG